jgi:hypothetical protein
MEAPTYLTVPASNCGEHESHAKGPTNKQTILTIAWSQALSLSYKLLRYYSTTISEVVG